MEEGPGLVTPCGGGRRSGGPGSRQGALPAEAVAGRAFTARAGERGGARGPRVWAWANRRT
jgi:hypothetical protein